MLRLAFDFIITWRETRTRPNAYLIDAIVLDFVEEGMIFCFSDYNEILYGSFCKDYDYKEC